MSIVGDSYLLGFVKGVNGAATGDQGMIKIEATNYIIDKITVTNASATPVLAQAAIRTAASGGGSAIVAAAVLTSLTSAAIFSDRTLAAPATTSVLNADNLYVNVTVANADPLTFDVYVYGRPVTP